MKINKEQLEIISKTAATVAIEKYKAEQEEKEKQRYDRRLHNVKLLLRNYRSLATHVADIKLEIVELDEKLDLAYLESDEFAITSIKRSKNRTLAIIKFINKMLQVYKLMCEQSDNPDDIRRYETIYHLYIADDKKTVKEISKVQFLTERTVYKNINKACKDLTVLIFGVDGLRF